MLIIAGSLFIAEGDRQDYLDAVAGVTAEAREAPGCLDFVQAADPLDPTRIVIFERWESAEDLEAYRTSGEEGDDDAPVAVEPGDDADGAFSMPEITSAEVHRYEVAGVSEP